MSAWLCDTVKTDLKAKNFLCIRKGAGRQGEYDCRNAKTQPKHGRAPDGRTESELPVQTARYGLTAVDYCYTSEYKVNAPGALTQPVMPTADCAVVCMDAVRSLGARSAVIPINCLYTVPCVNSCLNVI